MTRVFQIEPIFVEFIPDDLEWGTLYISRRYSTASHLCCCGCGLEVITPLNPVKWDLSEADGTVSLAPSIGNWSFACKSHYWITRNQVRWAGTMSKERIAAVKAHDRLDAVKLGRRRRGRLRAMAQHIVEHWSNAMATINSWLGR